MPLVVIGLGNPGKKYNHNRHNIGFRVIDALAQKLSCKLSKPFLNSNYLICKSRFKGRVIYLVKPLTFMNRSGEVVKTILKKAKAALKDLVVVYDNLDLKPGICKLKMQQSTAGHNGLESVFLHIKSDAIMCVAIGIGRPSYKSQVVDYVLSDPPASEIKLIDQAIEKVVSALLQLSRDPAQKVMNVLNKKQ